MLFAVDGPCKNLAGGGGSVLTQTVGLLSGTKGQTAPVSGIKILYMSAYTTNAIVHHGVHDPNMSFLQKPFSPSSLASKVDEVLHARTMGPHSTSGTQAAED